MSGLEQIYVELLYRALKAPAGIAVRVAHPGETKKALQKFYRVRKVLADPQLDVLSFRRSPDDEGVIWICKTKQQG